MAIRVSSGSQTRKMAPSTPRSWSALPAPFSPDLILVRAPVFRNILFFAVLGRPSPHLQREAAAPPSKQRPEGMSPITVGRDAQVGLLVASPCFAEAARYYSPLRVIAVGMTAWYVSLLMSSSVSYLPVTSPSLLRSAGSSRLLLGRQAHLTVSSSSAALWCGALTGATVMVTH